MKLSPHFSRSEFACKCSCGFDTVDTRLLEVLETVRQHYGTTVTILSGCRCETHNSYVGGASGSQHKLGRASDFVVSEHSPAKVQKYLKDTFPDELGIGSYDTFTHVDTRKGYTRWS